MKYSLLTQKIEADGKSASFNFGIETFKDPTESFSFGRWYFDCFAYVYNACYDFCYTEDYWLRFIERIDPMRYYDYIADLGVSPIWMVIHLMQNPETYEKIFNIMVDNAIDLDVYSLGDGIEKIKFDEKRENNAFFLTIHRGKWNKHKYIARFSDGCVKIYGNRKGFDYYDYVHLAQLTGFATLISYGATFDHKFSFKKPRPIYDGTHLIGIEFDVINDDY